MAGGVKIMRAFAVSGRPIRLQFGFLCFFSPYSCNLLCAAQRMDNMRLTAAVRLRRYRDPV